MSDIPQDIAHSQSRPSHSQPLDIAHPNHEGEESKEQTGADDRRTTIPPKGQHFEESDSIFEILNDWERQEREKGRTEWGRGRGRGRGGGLDRASSLSPRFPDTRPTLWRYRALEFCKCFACYVVGTFVIALCVYFMYRIFSTIRWSSW